MIRLALRSLAQHKLRTILSTLAVLFGVAMISGTYVLTDQINAGFKNIYDSAIGKIDVVVSPKPAFGGATGAVMDLLPASTLATVRGVDGVKTAEGGIQTLGVAVVNGKAVETGGGADAGVLRHGRAVRERHLDWRHQARRRIGCSRRRVPA